MKGTLTVAERGARADGHTGVANRSPVSERRYEDGAAIRPIGGCAIKRRAVRDEYSGRTPAVPNRLQEPPDHDRRDRPAARQPRPPAGKRASRPTALMKLLLIAHFPVRLGLAFLHGQWLVAIVGGGIATGAAVWATTTRPGTFESGAIVAAALMIYSGVFIQESNGLIEAHFHVFVVARLPARVPRLPRADRRRRRDRRPPRRRPPAAAAREVRHHTRSTDNATPPDRRRPRAVRRLRDRRARRALEEDGERGVEHQPSCSDTQDAERAELLALAQGLERRDLSVATGDGDESSEAVAALGSGIANVSDLVEAIQRSATGVTERLARHGQRVGRDRPRERRGRDRDRRHRPRRRAAAAVRARGQGRRRQGRRVRPHHRRARRPRPPRPPSRPATPPPRASRPPSA